MKTIFYKLIARCLIAIKYSDLSLRDLFVDYEVNEDADKFLIEIANRSSMNKLRVRMTIPRRGVKHSFLETAAVLLENLDSVLDWYKKEEKS